MKKKPYRKILVIIFLLLMIVSFPTPRLYAAVADSIGNCDDIEINVENFQDENFRNWILQQSYGTDGRLSQEEISGITSIDVSEQGILYLTGIEYFASLEYLRSYNNKLNKLDKEFCFEVLILQ